MGAEEKKGNMEDESSRAYDHLTSVKSKGPPISLGDISAYEPVETQWIG